jgi:hypothetical protein
MVGWGRNDAECLDTARCKIGVKPTETSHSASAERTIYTSKEAEKHWAATEVVT